MKKAISCLFALLMALTIGSAAADEWPVNEDLSGTLRVLGWANDDSLSGREAIVAAFSEKYPNVTVEDSWFPTSANVDAKEDTGLAAGTAEDVLICSPDWFGLRAQWYEDLAPYLQADGIDPYDYYVPSIWDASVLPTGKVEALPINANALCIVYNKTLFDEAGVDLPAADWSWDDFYDLCVKLAHGEGYERVYGCANINMQYVLADAWGGSPMTADRMASNILDPLSIKGYQKYQDLIFVEKAMPDGQTQESMPNETMFVSGLAAMYLCHPSILESMEELVGGAFEWGVINPPCDPDGVPTSCLWIDALAINKASNVKDLAWEFVKFFSLSDEAAVITADTTGMPVTKHIAETYYAANNFRGSDVSRLGLYEAAQGAVLFQFGGALMEHSVGTREMRDEIQYGDGTQDVAAILAKWEPKFTQILSDAFTNRVYD